MTNPLGPDFPIADPYTPANGPTFDEYRWSQLTEENRVLKTELESLSKRVATHSNSLATLIDRQNATQTRLDAVLAHLEETQTLPDSIKNLIDTVGTLLEWRESLDGRLAELENAGKPPAKPKDELNERVVAFLESHPELKFTAISIDENLGGTGRDISDRLKTLARNGRIRIFANDKRRPFYQALERPAPVEDQPTS